MEFHYFDPLVCLLLIMTHVPNGQCQRTKCGKGQFLSRRGNQVSCQPCESGTFMDENNHQYKSCKLCTRADIYAYQILVRNCTLTTDAQIGCLSGYFRTGPNKDVDCYRCTDCRDLQLFEAQSCGPDRDTICCQHDGMAVEWDDDQSTPHCVSRPQPAQVKCSKGHYLHTDGTCMPCPAGTFMNKRRHSYVTCKPCTIVQPYLNQIEKAVCTVTRDTVIRCQKGYYKYTGHHTECLKCTDCEHELVKKYEGKKCRSFSDTVCCSQPNMAVIVGADGSSKCLSKSYLDSNPCGRDQFLSISKKNRRKCLPCPAKTFVSKEQHNLSECIPCTQANSNHPDSEIVSSRCEQVSNPAGHKIRNSGRESTRKRKCEGSSLEKKKCRERKWRQFLKRRKQRCLKRKLEKMKRRDRKLRKRNKTRRAGLGKRSKRIGRRHGKRKTNIQLHEQEQEQEQGRTEEGLVIREDNKEKVNKGRIERPGNTTVLERMM